MTVTTLTDQTSVGTHVKCQVGDFCSHKSKSFFSFPVPHSGSSGPAFDLVGDGKNSMDVMFGG